MSKIKTVIFGGSFDPIHTGHIALAKAVIDENLADEVWFMVSPLNPHKQGQGLTCEQVRLRMVQLAIEGEKGLAASDFEFRLPRPSYTLHTLEALEAAYPERSFALLIGADNWLKFGSWYRGDEIKARYPIIVYPRDSKTTTLPEKGATLLEAQLHDISSTHIRESIASGNLDAVAGWLSPEVLDYIRENKLYI